MRRAGKADRTTPATPPQGPLSQGLPPRFTVHRGAAGTAGSAEPTGDADSAGENSSWRITDGVGEVVVDGIDSRRLAIRMMATYATKRPLPLRVEDASGMPTGDRLGG